LEERVDKGNIGDQRETEQGSSKRQCEGYRKSHHITIGCRSRCTNHKAIRRRAYSFHSLPWYDWCPLEEPLC